MRPVYGAMISLLMVTFHGISAQGTGGSSDWAFCKGSCTEGQGDCDVDTDCAGELLCGQDNCRHFHSNALSRADCCFRPGIGSSFDWDFCKGNCSWGAGDCDK